MQTFIKPPAISQGDFSHSMQGIPLWDNQGIRVSWRWRPLTEEQGEVDGFPWCAALTGHTRSVSDFDERLEKYCNRRKEENRTGLLCMQTHTHIWMKVLHMCKHFQQCQSFSLLSCLFALTTANVAAQLITISPTRCVPRCLPLPVFFPLGYCPPVISPGEFILQDSILLFTATHFVIAAARGSCLSSKACGDPPSTLCIHGCMLTDALCFTWWGLQMCKPQRRFYTCCG